MNSGSTIEDLIRTVIAAEEKQAAYEDRIPRRFPWAEDEDVEALEAERPGIEERYR